jgi:hypothetical protein
VKSANISVKRLSLCGITGLCLNPLFSLLDNQTYIVSAAELHSGIYLLTVEYSDNYIDTFKFVKK